jgi:hypothetical protein
MRTLAKEGRMRFFALTLVLVTGAAPTIAATTADTAPGRNLVANGDFQRVTGGKPDQWQTAGDDSVTQTLAAAEDADGRPIAQLICTRCDKRTPASHAMLAQVGVVRLIKGRTYEFSCRARAEGLRGRAISVSLPDTKTWTDSGLYEQLAVGRAWKTYRRLFRASQDVGPTGRLQFWFTEPGTLCLADVRIVECAQPEVEFTDTVPPAGVKNLVANGSFEVGPSGWASLGLGAGWGDLGCLHGRVEREGGTHGRALLRIALGGASTPVLYFDYYEPVVRRELRPLAASLGWIPVEKGTAYTISCDMRASRDGVRAALGARAEDPMGQRRDYLRTVELTRAWQRCSLTFRPECRYVFVLAGPDLVREEQVYVDIDAVQLEKGEAATAFEPRSPVEFAVEPAEPGGIFVEGRPAALHMRACNHGTAPVRADVRFEVTDFDDKPVALPAQSLEAPAGGSVERELKVPADWKGFYRVRAACRAGGKTAPADVRLAILPARTGDDSACGINHAFPSAYLIRLAAKAGVTWYRDWSLKWQQVEPVKGEFHWQRADAQIDRVVREGAHLTALLPPFPSADWSSEAPPGLPTTGYPGVRLRQAWGPKDPADLAAFIERAASRYKDRIHVWEFLNEPIYTDYALPADSARRYGGKRYAPADYVSLLRAAAVAMRKADPACKVMGGIGSGPLHLTRETIEAGGLKCIDILDLHVYPGSRTPESYAPEMDELAAMMDAHGGRRPIWVTEFAYYGADDLPRKPFFPGPGSWADERLLESERQCAQFTVRFFAVMLSRGVQKVFLHSGASARANQPNLECVLFGYGGAPRKLLPALGVLTDLVGPWPSCAGRRRLGESGHAVAFETAPRSVVVLWQEDDEAAGRVTGRTSADVRWMDMMGRTIGAPLALTGSPVYLVGPPGKAKVLLDALGADGSPAVGGSDGRL